MLYYVFFLVYFLNILIEFLVCRTKVIVSDLIIINEPLLKL